MNLLHRSRASISAACLFAAVAASCTNSYPLEGLPCPCTGAYECCDGVCVEQGGGGTCGRSTKRVTNESDETGDITGSGQNFPLDPQVRVLTDGEAKCATTDADQIYFMDRKASIASVAKVSDGASPQSQSRSLLDVPTQNVEVCGIARDGDDLYATLFGSGTIAKLSVNKLGDAVTIGEKGFTFGALITPSSLVVDEAFVYVAERDSGLIKRFDKATLTYEAPTPATATVLGQGGLRPHDLIADAAHLYWIDSGGIRRMSKQGGSITTLTSTEGGAELKIFDGALFWIDHSRMWTMPLNLATPATTLHFIEQRARENWAKKRALEESGGKSKNSSEPLPNPTDEQLLEDARDPETDEGYAALFFDITAYTFHQGAIYFASNRHVYAASSHGGDAARVFVYRVIVTQTEPDKPPAAHFLTIDSDRYIWASAGALFTRPR